MLGTHRFLLQEMSAGNAVLFCGAGVSQGRYPTWSTLVQRLATDMGLPTRNVDYLDLPQWYVEANGREALEQYLVRTFSAEDAPTNLQRILARFSWDTVFTTNYDRLLEQAFGEQGRQIDVVVEDPQIGRVTERSRMTLVKMHGCVSRPHTLVVTREDYDSYDLHHPAIITYLQSLLSTRTFLFVGFSLRDPNFRNIYRIVQQVLGSFRRYAYAILLQRAVNDYVLQYWRRQRLLILPVASPQQVQAFLAEAQDTASRWSSRQRRLPAILQGLGAESETLRSQVEALSTAVDGIADRMRLPLLPAIRERGDERSMGPPGALLWSRTTVEERQQLYSLHNLLLLLEEIGVAVPAQRWLRLGNTLYELEKWDLALQAYQRVYTGLSQRRLAPESTDESEVHPKEIAGDLARCYLAVAQERLDAFRRISGDETVVLDLAEYEWAEGHLARCILTESGHLDHGWLAQRPTDLAEYAYVSNRLAEIEIARDQLQPAWQRLLQALCYQEQGRGLYRSGMGNWARAYALNHLGKSYRLCTEIAIAQGRLDHASQNFSRARATLLEAIAAAPALGYPFGHLFDLLRLVEDKGLEESFNIHINRERIALRLRLENLNDGCGETTRAWLQAHYPEVWAG